MVSGVLTFQTLKQRSVQPFNSEAFKLSTVKRSTFQQCHLCAILVLACSGKEGDCCPSFYGLSIVWCLIFFTTDVHVVEYSISVFLEPSPFLSHK